MSRIAQVIRKWLNGASASDVTLSTTDAFTSSQDEVLRSESEAWMRARGFSLVLDPFLGRYASSFIPEREYEFMRPEWEEPKVFRLCDQHPAFNLWGLQYRSP